MSKETETKLPVGQPRLVVPLPEFKPGDLVTITEARFQPWIWVGIECRLLVKTESGQWKMVTTKGTPHVCYFEEYQIRHNSELCPRQSVDNTP